MFKTEIDKMTFCKTGRHSIEIIGSSRIVIRPRRTQYTLKNTLEKKLID